MADEFQYVKLPDGSYGKFSKGASDAEIRAKVAAQFPAAYKAQPGPGAAPAQAPAKAPVEDWQPMDTKPPENARFPKMGRTGYKAADFISNLLPGAGATIGAVNVETGPGAVALATAGGAVGERASHYLNRALYKDLPHESLGDAATSMAVQGALGGVSEGAGRVFSGVLGKMIPALRRSAETAAEAKAGLGVRLTPGEVSGNKMVKLGENVLEHLPGASGTFKTFREAQSQDALVFLDKHLENLSAQKLSSEETGKELLRVVQEAKATSKLGVDAKFEEVRALLGKEPGSHISPEDFDKAIAEHESDMGKQLGAGFRVTGSLARQKLINARQLYKQELDRFDREIFDKILKTDKPELVGAYLEKAGFEDLRRLRTEIPPHVADNAARNVLENMIHTATDAQTGNIGARSLSTEIKKLGEGRGRLIFGPQYDSVVEGANLLGKINSHESEMFGRMHAAKFMGTITLGLMGLFGFGGLRLAAEGLGSELLFAKMAALALTRPGISAKALTILRGAAVAAARGIPYVVDESLMDSPARYRADLPEPLTLEPR